MAMKIGAASEQVVFRRFFIVSRQFSEKEKAAILKKVEEYKRKKLARKDPNPGETAALGSGGSTGVKANTAASSKPTVASSEKVSTLHYLIYAVIASSVTALGAMGWYLKPGGRSQRTIQDRC